MNYNLHSVVDIITNSSTCIYTSYENAIEPVKKLIAEFLVLSNVDKPIDEIVNIFLTVDREHYEYYLDDAHIEENEAVLNIFPELATEHREKKAVIIDNILDDIFNFNELPPKWFIDFTNQYISNSEGCNSYINFIIKDHKYDKLIDYIKDVLFAVKTEEGLC